MGVKFNKSSRFWWSSLILWIFITIVAVLCTPNINNLVLQKGQPKIPSNYSYEVAQRYIDEYHNYNDNNNMTNFIIVFSNSKELSNSQLDSIKASIEKLKSDSTNLGIEEITTHFDNTDLTDQLFSKDKTTVLVSVIMDKKDKSMDTVEAEINKELSGINVPHYLTGASFITHSYIQSNMNGVHKTELFTGIIIFIILFLVFRSPITPLISLITVIATYFTSLGIVTQLAEKFDFPFATTTQSYLILVLFGIGTDYSLLLLTRFKDELSRNPIDIAIKNTYKTSGKTVLVSSLTVLVGFGTLWFANFSIYRASSAVAIAVAILIVSLFTLLRFFMSVFGNKIFWPTPGTYKHPESRIWSKLTGVSTKHPFIVAFVILAITLSVIFSQTNTLSYNMIKEMDPNYESVKAFNIVANKFSEGTASPVTIYLKNDTALNNSNSLSDLDKLTANLGTISNVDKVYSVTRPKGSKLDQLYLNNQLNSVTSGLDSANAGISEVSNGLKTASAQLSSSMDLSHVNELIQGTSDVSAGLSNINNALLQIKDGIDKGTSGSTQLNDGISKISSNMALINTSTTQLHQATNSLYQGYQQLNNNYIAAYQQARSELDVGAQQTFSALNSAFAATNNAFPNLIGGISQLSDGQTQIQAGLNSLSTACNVLTKGLSQCSAGQSTVIDNMNKIQAAIVQINDGQKSMLSALNTVKSKISTLQSGLNSAVSGLNTISNGIGSANTYLKNLSSSSTGNLFYIPSDQINSGDFQKSINSYMSSDYKMTRLMIILSVDPYSEQAMHVVSQIEKCIGDNLYYNSLSRATYGIDGASSTNRDLKTVSTGDLNFSMTIMLLGIGIILICISKSIVKSIAIIGSLLIANYTGIAITHFIFSDILKIGELSWSIPFFSFVMIVALGVDYSIFFLMQFNEFKSSDINTSLIKSSAKIGGVIMSAAFILSGTFAALYPSTVPTLVELATIVIIALILLTFILVPMFVPAIAVILHKIISKLKAKFYKK